MPGVLGISGWHGTYYLLGHSANRLPICKRGSRQERERRAAPSQHRSAWGLSLELDSYPCVALDRPSTPSFDEDV